MCGWLRMEGSLTVGVRRRVGVRAVGGSTAAAAWICPAGNGTAGFPCATQRAVVATATGTSNFAPVPGSTTPQPLTFLALGDWGRQNTGTNDQISVAAGMAAAATSLSPAFVVSVGDNFYQNGLATDTDPLFTTDFTNVYSAASLQLPWHVALGNHDYYGVSSAQVSPRLPTAADPRWYAYRSQLRTFQPPGYSNPLVALYFVDTNPWLQAYRGQAGLNWAGITPPVYVNDTGG